MIERFNFYDLYGYLIPGLVLVALVWLPFGVAAHTWPPAEVSSAALALVVAYIAGHFLQTIATNAIPSTVPDQNGTERYPSVFVLDKSNATFSPKLKDRIARIVRTWFELELSVDQDAKDEPSKGKRDPVADSRQDAFFLCRRVVNMAASGSYAEQHQGLYAMMRGLFVVFSLGFFYTVGWAVAPYSTSPMARCIAVGVLIASLFAIAGLSIARIIQGLQSKSRYGTDRYTLWALVALMLFAGYLLETGVGMPPGRGDVLWVVIALFALVAIRFYNSHRFFAVEFAKAVWSNFAAEPAERPRERS